LLGLTSARPRVNLRGVGTDRARARARRQLEDLAASEVDSETLRWEAIGILRRAVGFTRWCWPSADPGSALHLGGIGELDSWPSVGRCILLEQTEDPRNAIARLAAGPARTATLAAETGGDLARSPRWRDGMRSWGIGDELRSALVDELGMWGFVDLLRDSDDSPFGAEDVALLEDAGPALAAALRRRAARQDAPVTAPPPAGAGVVVLDEELTIRSWTPAAALWLDALGPPGAPPLIVLGVAARALALARHVAAHSGDRVRARARTGHWVVAEGAVLEGAAAPAIAVTLRPAAADDIFDVVCASYRLSQREQELVRLLATGSDTLALARKLRISRHTVQDHLKSVFEKTGVRSRRELGPLLRSGTLSA
jgi:DNA-binding CsgD family transcriptional regulator